MNTCAMEGCQCPVSGGNKYCSDDCARHHHSVNGGCLCNHPECTNKGVAG